MERDTRLVQTAVVGSADSHDPVVMPMTRFEAERFRNTYRTRHFWCGTVLGGCGRELITRVGLERIPHFAHTPGAVCHRIHRDRASADHLFVNRDLLVWLQRNGHWWTDSDFKGNFHSGDTCTCLEIELQARRDRRKGVIAVAFKGFDISAMQRREAAHGKNAPWFNWLFDPELLPPPELLERDGYALHFELDRMVDSFAVRIGTRPRKGNIKWAVLDDCTIDDFGISTPLVVEIREEMRRKRTVIPVAERQKPAEVEAESVRVIPFVEFRRSMLSIGRKYGIDGDFERASLCLRLGMESSLRTADLPPWLWGDVQKVLGLPAPKRTAVTEHQGQSSAQRVDAEELLLAPLDERLDDIFLSDQLVNFIEKIGCSVKASLQRMRWLRLATVHRGDLCKRFPDAVGRSVLPALAMLAKLHVRAALLDFNLKNRQPKSAHDQEAVLRSNEARAWKAIARMRPLRQVARPGDKEHPQAQISNPDIVVHQIIGVVALLGGHRPIQQLVRRTLASSSVKRSDGQSEIRWRDMLGGAIGMRHLIWKYDKTGPSHAPVIVARVTDQRGRSAADMVIR